VKESTGKVSSAKRRRGGGGRIREEKGEHRAGHLLTQKSVPLDRREGARITYLGIGDISQSSYKRKGKERLESSPGKGPSFNTKYGLSPWEKKEKKRKRE